MKRRAGFTLIELILAVAIGAIILSLAVPSIVGEFKKEKLDKTFSNFDDFVQKVRVRSCGWSTSICS